MKLTWYGHSCFKLENNNYSLVMDPYTGVEGYPELNIDANAVYASHGHYDHNYFRAVHITDSSAEASEVITAESVKSWHDDRNGALRGENLINIFSFNGMSVVHLGDLGHQLNDSRISALFAPDVLLVPVGGIYTVDAKGAKSVCDDLNPKIIIPMHYRDGNRGIPSLAARDEFLSLFPQDMLHYYDGNTFEFDSMTEPQLVVFR